MPEARVVLKEEYTHACPVVKLMPSMIRLQDALLTPLKQLQISGVGVCARMHYKPGQAVYPENCELL